MHMAAREWNQEVCEYICKVAPECARVRDSVRPNILKRFHLAFAMSFTLFLLCLTERSHPSYVCAEQMGPNESESSFPS